MDWAKDAKESSENREQQTQQAQALVEQEVNRLNLQSFLEAVRDTQPEFKIPSHEQAKNTITIRTQEKPEGTTLAGIVYHLEKEYPHTVVSIKQFVIIKIFAVLQGTQIHLERQVYFTESFFTYPLRSVLSLDSQYGQWLDINIDQKSRLTANITIEVKEDLRHIHSKTY